MPHHMQQIQRLNDDVWQPFQQAYATADIDLFRSIHADDFVRIQVADGWLGSVEQYMAQTAPRFEKSRLLGDSLQIDFRFTDRILAAEMAYERGIFCITVTSTDGSRRDGHGRFLTVARLVDGRWRLTLDQDDDEGGAVDASAFAAAHPMDDRTPVRFVEP